MKRFILLTILCCLVLSISAQIARDEIFEDIHRSAANHYAYPDPHFTMTAPLPLPDDRYSMIEPLLL